LVTKVICLDKMSDIMEFVNEAHKVNGDILVRKGVYIVDGKSIMGIISLSPSDGVTVEYPEDASDFADYINSKF